MLHGSFLLGSLYPLTHVARTIWRPTAQLVIVLVATFGVRSAQAAPPVAEKPIRALLVTGGCCHDYGRQKLVLTKGISARANVVWTVAHQGGNGTSAKIPLYEDPNWAEGFDIVVHNECFADDKDPEWVERILKPHREGVPAVLIHCAMHCYRTGDDRWFEFCGVQSPGHGPNFAYDVENLQPEHPIMRGFGPKWAVAKGELYNTVKLWPTATPLGQGRRPSDNQPQVCFWTNQYKKARVFGTTIGHYNETMADPVYLDTVTRGLLWAAGRLEGATLRKPDAETNAAIQALTTAPAANKPNALAGKCCGEGNLALGKTATTSSQQSGNFAPNAVDGKLDSRWCVNGSHANEWWQVDLGQPEHVKSLRIHWERNEAYRYRIETSTDGENWRPLVDQAENKTVVRITPHEVDAPQTRFVRVTFLGSSGGGWGSFWEFEAYADKLPELPAEVSSDNGPVDPAQLISSVTVPEGFQATIFGAPPTVNYPVCLTAAATGEVFVGVDEQGSLGKEKNRGRVLRCLDTDGDGQADKINVFAEMDHPRGLIYDNGSLWGLHPPFLSVYHDDNHDGQADRHETLITGISTDQIAKRGADHTTNGIRMGIDGWIYIAVGDFGFCEAKGADGRELRRRGGGIVRIRPDGSDMEIYAWGLRNILDVAIDPYLNMFTRDNTNDGGGWNVRVSHILQTAEYGYPSLYINFADEIMPPLADFGGGSGCGKMFLYDQRWPTPYNDAFYSCDWGRSEVYLHNLPAQGATFDPHQEVFAKIPRPTDIDVDGSGRMYVSSWKDGGFSFSSPNVGFVAQITPRDFVPKPFPDLAAASDQALIEHLKSPSAVHHLHTQREILRRGRNTDRSVALLVLASDANTPLASRVAAIFTLKQLDGQAANAELLKLLADDAVREFALRALTDRKGELSGVPVEPLVAALGDAQPRVRAQALISLGRLGDATAAEKILPLTRRATDTEPPTAEPFHAQADAGRVAPHLAVRALVALNAAEVCLAGLDGPYRDGALWALRNMHSDAAVDGLVARLSRATEPVLRQAILATLIRLYFQEGEYVNSDWWGTRPDTSGPYYDRKTWAQSERIARLVRNAVQDSDAATGEFLKAELAKHKVVIEGLATESVATASEPQQLIAAPMADPNNPEQIANLPYEQVLARASKVTGDAERGQALFTQQSCVACHTYADGQTPKGPHLVDIGKRYKRAELIESIVNPNAKIAQGFETFAFITSAGTVLTGFVVSESAEHVEVRQTDGLAVQLVKEEIDERAKQETSMMPTGLVGNLTPEQLADLLAYLESLK